MVYVYQFSAKNIPYDDNNTSYSIKDYIDDTISGNEYFISGIVSGDEVIVNSGIEYVQELVSGSEFLTISGVQ